MFYLRLYFTCFLLGGISTLGTAQSADFDFPDLTTRIYPVSAKIVGQLLREELAVSDLPDPGTPLPSATTREELPPGHYLAATLNGDQVDWAWLHTYKHEVSVRESPGKLSLRVFDADGRERNDATITADGKPVRYRPKEEVYRRRDWRIDHLRVIVDQDTLLYAVEEDVYGSRFRHDLHHTSTNPLGYLVLSPYRILRGTYWNIRSIVKYGNWRFHNYPFRRTIQRIANPRSIRGYVAISQPIYRPGDTLRLSAYLSKPGGRPLTADSVYMVISQGYQYEDALRIRIGRTEKGRYECEMAIPEDWQLDQEYRVSFYRFGILPRDIDPEISFGYSDYELAEYKLTVEASPETTFPGPAWLDIRAEDVNGLSLPDGMIDVAVLTEKVVDTGEAASLTLPDTLWHYQEPTDDRRERRVVIPDSLFPAGYSLKVKAVVRLTGPSGEYNEDQKYLTVDRRFPIQPRIRVRGDSVFFSAFSTSSAPAPIAIGAPSKAVLQTINSTADTLIQTVDLPTALAIDHRNKAYRLGLGDLTVREDLDDLKPFSNEPVNWSHDTLRLAFPNPHQQQFRWSLRTEDGEIAAGNQAAPSYQQSGFLTGAAVSLDVQYYAGGNWHHKLWRTDAPAYDLLTSHRKVLNFELTPPATVRPGETVQMTLQATDQEGKPAAGVHLSAGTYNARFDEVPAELPAYDNRQKYRRRRQRYQLQTYTKRHTTPVPHWLITDLGFSELPAYELRFPDPEFQLSRSLDSLMPSGITDGHLAPFVIRNNEFVAIRTVYADDHLVYWHNPNTTTPYSIPLDSGRHRIQLRTYGFIYEKELFIAPRQQLVISFDADRWASAGWTRTKSDWTQDEVDNVYSRVFALTEYAYQPAYFFRPGPNQPVQSAKFSRSNTYLPLGLSVPGDSLTFWLPQGDTVSFPFEPRARYRITPERDRLYPLDREVIVGSLRRVWTPPLQPGLPRYAAPRVMTRKIFRFLKEAGKLPNVFGEGAITRLQFDELPEGITDVVLAPTWRDTFYHVSKYRDNKMLAGTYDVLYRFVGDSVRWQRVDLLDNTLTFLTYTVGSTRPFIDYADAPQLSVAPIRKEAIIKNETYRYGNSISGVITDESGEVLIGASILIKGTTVGTVTDIDGRFVLRKPFGPVMLVVSYTGFATLEVPIYQGYSGGTPLVIQLAESASQLNEVVVTALGYYSVAGKDYWQEQLLPSRDIDQMTGRAAGVSISDDSGADFIRGSRTDDDSFYVDGVRISSRDLLDSALGLVDDRNANIVGSQLAPVITRKNFADYAAFIPNLRTDARGQTAFDVTFPDDITAWNTYAVGQDRRRRVGFTEARTTAFLPLQAQLYLPRFLVAGDSSEAIGLAINRTGKEQAVRLSFTGNGKRARTQDAMVGSSVQQRFPIGADGLENELSYRFTLQTTSGPAESDGEQRSVPVYPVGTLMTSGTSLLLADGDSSLPIDFVQPELGNLTLHLVGNRIDRLLADVEYVIDYPYECTEQTASRLLGLLALKHIRTAEKKAFNRERDVRRMIRKLERIVRSDGGYGWWPASPEASIWITAHVFRALSAAETAGYRVEDVQGLVRFLLGRMPELPAREQLDLLLLIAEYRLPFITAEWSRVNSFATGSDYEFLAVTRLRQLRGDTVDVAEIISRSTSFAPQGRFWGEADSHFTRLPLNDRMAATLLAHHILRAEEQDELADAAISYLLQRESSGPVAYSGNGRFPVGRNTLESARLLAALVPYLTTEGSPLRGTTVAIHSGSEVETVSEFPYTKEIEPSDLPGLRLRKTGSGPMIASLSQQYFEAMPSPADDGFSLTSRLTDVNGRKLDKLTRGMTAYAEVSVSSAAAASYVLIEVPVPAGCSYDDRNESKGPYAVHREYRRDRVAVFCDHLPAGDYVYRVALAPRFNGQYIVNPARAELQYSPEVSGQGRVEQIVVQEE